MCVLPTMHRSWTAGNWRGSTSGVPEGVYRLARRQFSEKELVDLTMVIIAINSWNRLAVSFRAVAGTYQPGSVTTPQAQESKHPKMGTQTASMI